MNADLIAQSLPLLLKGLIYTVGLALFGMAMGLLLGLDGLELSSLILACSMPTASGSRRSSSG